MSYIHTVLESPNPILKTSALKIVISIIQCLNGAIEPERLGFGRMHEQKYLEAWEKYKAATDATSKNLALLEMKYAKEDWSVGGVPDGNFGSFECGFQCTLPLFALNRPKPLI